MEGEVPVGVPAWRAGPDGELPDELPDERPAPRLEVLAEADWTARRTAHERRVHGWVAPWLARRARGRRHPVDDFLFEYYSYSPGKLRRWHPGAGVVLAGPAAERYRALPGYADL